MAQIAVGCLQLFADRKVVLSVLTTATFTGVLVTLVFALTLTCGDPRVNTTVHQQTEFAGLTYIEKNPQEGTMIEQLLSMGCKPHLQKVQVNSILREMLKPQDELLDKLFVPSVLPVWRCSEALSYCWGKSGIMQRTVCQSVNATKEKFTVKYNNGSGLVEMPVYAEVHRECHCSDPLISEET